jgi:hypothetical protein
MEPRESGSYSVLSFFSTPRKKLAIILSRSLGGGGICPKKDRTEYEPDSLGSMYNSLDRHLRDMKSPISLRYVLTFLSFKIVNCTTESVDGQSDYYRADIRQNLTGH